MARTGFWVAGEAERLDAVQDAAYDRFLEVAVTCRECGTLYDQGYHPARQLWRTSTRSSRSLDSPNFVASP